MPTIHGNFKFEVEIQGFVRARFQKVTGLSESTEVRKYRSGADNETPQNFPGQTTFDDVVFSRGVSDDDDFHNWRRAVYDPNRLDGSQGNLEGLKRDITIYLKDTMGNRVKYWTIVEAWPCGKSTGDLDADSNDNLIEEITVCHEGLIGPVSL